MNRRLGLLIMVLTAIGFLYGANVVRNSLPEEPKVEVVSQAHAAQSAQNQETAYREKLARWVYDHSSKISLRTCRQIVDEVMAYDHPVLLLALMQAESEFSPTAVSSAQAVGLGQVRWSIWGKTLQTAGILKEARDLYDIPMAIRAAHHVISAQIQATKGDPMQALERYVGGKHKPYVDKVAYNFMHLSMIKRVEISESES